MRVYRDHAWHPKLVGNRSLTALCRQQLAAALLALPAGVGADAAMLVHSGVAFALLAAGGARPLTCLEQAAQHLLIGTLAGEGGAGRGADVRAYLVESDAAGELGDGFLSEACIGACDACLRTVETGVDAASQSVTGEECLARTRLQHLCRVRHRASPFVVRLSRSRGRGPQRRDRDFYEPVKRGLGWQIRGRRECVQAEVGELVRGDIVADIAIDSAFRE